MTVGGAAASRAKKLMKLTISLLRFGFNPSKCKTAAKMALGRIKLLKNKRDVVVRQMRRDIALLLQSGQDATARIRVEHVIREQNVLAANELIKLFCELVVARLTIIAKQRECPADLKEGISSLIFAAPRCSEIPELMALRDTFEKKYGKDFVSAATDLRPSCGVNRMLIDKLSVRTPTGEVKLKLMKEIAKEYQIEWDTTESEKELLKPPEELIEGPRTFVSASSLPVKPAPAHTMEPNNHTTGSTGVRERGAMHFKDTVSAAEAAAEAAKKAIAAAEAAAYLANRDFNQSTQPSILDDKLNGSDVDGNFFQTNDPRRNSWNVELQFGTPGKMSESHSVGRAHYVSNLETPPAPMDSGNIYRRHTYGGTSANSDIKFDESDDDIEMEESPATLPPQHSPPPVPSSHTRRDGGPCVHPKLPDYEVLAARFEALKYRKSQP
ncbi:Regulator of Vps4 activity in the MVB pathway protein [Quillaja saponaria]|uniref:Regulator of Vps4 activity in the MVB pathway protein n=1 Tax=Quillaja saponaria TaxID=32244 RepID=A0AAD7L846_QUISA|nr:Regulator of Vps4 activity in the MVB pathway protein [Quillaja saponaria]